MAATLSGVDVAWRDFDRLEVEDRVDVAARADVAQVARASATPSDQLVS
jgi:hypothetical protein